MTITNLFRFDFLYQNLYHYFHTFSPQNGADPLLLDVDDNLPIDHAPPGSVTRQTLEQIQQERGEPTTLEINYNRHYIFIVGLVFKLKENTHVILPTSNPGIIL